MTCAKAKFGSQHTCFQVGQPRSQGLSSLPPLVVERETLVAAGHVTIYPSKTVGWVGTQVHLVERTIKYHPGEGEVEQLLFQNGARVSEMCSEGATFGWL